LGFYSAFPDADSRPVGVIFELESKADRTMNCDLDGDFDLGLGKVTDGSRSPLNLKFPEIKDFLESERHKNMVVVWFHKILMSGGDEAVAKKAAEVTQQMQGVGYKQVVILGMAGAGVHYVADTNSKAKGAK
jgi:hypothetical protein